MNKKDLSDLSNEELLNEAKNNKRTPIYDAVIIGFLIGISIYSSVKNGFGIITFFPIAYIPIAAKNRKRINEIKRLLKERNLSND